MNFFKVLLNLFVICLFLGCRQEINKTRKKIEIQTNLIHPLYFQDEVAANINFPFWFDDSLIQKNKIKTLTLTYFGGTVTDSLDIESSSLAKRTLIYTFNLAGQVVNLQITDFSEGIVISNQSFEIGNPQKYGYCHIVQKDNRYGVENNTFIYNPNKESTDYVAYQATNSVDLIHFILNEKYFGPLSVDSIAHPLPNDWIVLGQPDKPIKRYKTQNKVREKTITKYTYAQKNFPRRIESEDYPFIRSRTFRYLNGNFNAYIDSTFIDKTFVTSIRSVIYYDDKRLPIKINHQKEHVQGTNNFQSHEEIKYQFYENK